MRPLQLVGMETLPYGIRIAVDNVLPVEGEQNIIERFFD
jgi:hypothetical protein